MATVLIDRITKRYGSSAAVEDVAISLSSGEFLTLLGPSGCGKSTTLRAVAGLTSIDSGAIAIDGRDVTRIPIHHRNIGLVFQNLALFPHMTVAENVGFGLRMRGISTAERAERVAQALSLVHLEGFGERLPRQLSGGQQQRVAIARALVINPQVLLLDEPFSALDRQLREEMQRELRALTRDIGITAIFVTHDQEEALTLSDTIAVMNAGRVEQIGTPLGVFEYPETAFVADFMGSRNLLSGTVEAIDGREIRLRWAAMSLIGTAPEGGGVSIGDTVCFTIRPERIAIRPADGPLIAEVSSSLYQGAFTTVETQLADGSTLTLRQTGSEARALARGTMIGLGWQPEDILVLRSPQYPNDTHSRLQ